MSAYMLERIGPANIGQSTSVTLGASSEEEARNRAAAKATNREEELVWLDPTKSTCWWLSRAELQATLRNIFPNT